jgi:hypothetical protein
MVEAIGNDSAGQVLGFILLYQPCCQPGAAGQEKLARWRTKNSLR